MGVAGYEPHPAKTSGDQRAQKRSPESTVLAGTHVQAEDLPLPALGVHAHGDHHSRGGHSPVLASLHVGRVEPDVGVWALQRPTPEALDLRIQLLTEPRDLALGDARPYRGP
jgi:hypothetical protein